MPETSGRAAENGMPLHRKLNEHERVDLSALHIEYERAHESFDSIADRLFLQDPTAGCMDPTLIGRRDICTVTRITASAAEAAAAAAGEAAAEGEAQGVEEEPLKLYCFLAHMVTPQQLMARLCGDENGDFCAPDDPRLERILDDGTWAGTLLWDAAIHLANEMLRDEEMGALVKGRRVVELGCGLGLPGFVASRWLGASYVELTDREDVVHLCESNIELTKSHELMKARTIEWTDPQDLSQCGVVDVILAADCIFQPLYGDSWPLWDVLKRFSALAQDAGRAQPVILLSAERRPDDGIDKFLDLARSCGEVREWWQLEDRVFIYQLDLDAVLLRDSVAPS